MKTCSYDVTYKNHGYTEHSHSQACTLGFTQSRITISCDGVDHVFCSGSCKIVYKLCMSALEWLPYLDQVRGTTDLCRLLRHSLAQGALGDEARSHSSWPCKALPGKRCWFWPLKSYTPVFMAKNLLLSLYQVDQGHHRTIVLSVLCLFFFNVDVYLLAWSLSCYLVQCTNVTRSPIP